MKTGTLWVVRSLISILLIIAATRARAASYEVDWDSVDGFSPQQLTINAGDEVDFYNMDEDFDLMLSGDLSGDIPAGEEGGIVLSTPDTYNVSDEFGNPLTITVDALAPLSVAITSPANNAVFAAPATFTMTAVPVGGATPYAEVDFYVGTAAGTNHVGVAYDSPYTNEVTSLPAGTYVLTAIVTDNDLNTATNSVTNIVVSAGPIQLKSPRIVSNQFLFDVSGLTVGKTNLTQSSSNMVNWASIKTNIAAASSVTYTNSVTAGLRFYKLFQLP